MVGFVCIHFVFSRAIQSSGPHRWERAYLGLAVVICQVSLKVTPDTGKRRAGLDRCDNLAKKVSGP
jgi:hypothetical protein